MVCGREFACLFLILYALFLSGCSKQGMAEADETERTQDVTQLEEMVTPERETWWNNGNAEHGSLSVDEVQDFLKQYGFDAREPFYVYGEEEDVQLELYYDAETDIGCGIRYGDGKGGTTRYGFVFYSSEETEWEYWNPFSVAALYDDGAYMDTQMVPIRDYTGARSVSDYEEEYEYNAQGQLAAYRFRGIIDKKNSDKEWEDILKVDFLYRADGTLCEKNYSHNINLLGSSYSEQQHFFDEQERLRYAFFPCRGPHRWKCFIYTRETTAYRPIASS